MSAVRRTIRSFCLALSVVGAAPQVPALADSVPLWGAKASVPIDTPINHLKKSEFLWMAESVTTGPVVTQKSLRRLGIPLQLYLRVTFATQSNASTVIASIA